MRDVPVYREYEIGALNLSATEMVALADLVVGGPVYIRLSDRKVVATVDKIAINKTALILRLKFEDQDLALNIDNQEYVGSNYELLDPVECVLYIPH